MTNYRRFKIPGATYFFTLCLEERGSRLLVDRIADLRSAYAQTVRELPVFCPAMVVLPDHLHAIWTEPAGEVNYSERWRRIKARFSHLVGPAFVVNHSKARKREAGVWQRRFWEHTVRDEAELRAAMVYCQMNPVKHGLVTCPEDWPYSSYVRRMGNIAHPTGSTVVSEN
jgi:putative transposase